MSHTPGPWEIQYLGNGESEVLANGPDQDDAAGICIVAGGLGHVMEDNRDYESEANARLIAAAPELLAAGELVVERWCKGDLAEAVNLLNAAIEKARKG